MRRIETGRVDDCLGGETIRGCMGRDARMRDGKRIKTIYIYINWVVGPRHMLLSFHSWLSSPLPFQATFRVSFGSPSKPSRKSSQQASCIFKVEMEQTEMAAIRWHHKFNSTLRESIDALSLLLYFLPSLSSHLIVHIRILRSANASHKIKMPPCLC